MPNPVAVDIPQPIASPVTDGADKPQPHYSQFAQDASGKKMGFDGQQWVEVPFQPTQFAKDPEGNTVALDIDNTWVEPATRRPFAPKAGSVAARPEVPRPAAPAMQEMGALETAGHIAEPVAKHIGSAVEEAGETSGIVPALRAMSQVGTAGGALLDGDPEKANELAKKAFLVAKEVASKKMQEFHAHVAQDQEVTANAQKLMKAGDLRGAAELIDRHLTIRALQSMKKALDPAGVAEKTAGLADMSADITQEAIDLARKGEYGKAIGHFFGPAVPFMVPGGEAELGAKSAAEGAVEATPKVTEEIVAGAPGILRPGTVKVAGEQIPVRAEGTVADIAESTMSNAQKTRLQEFEAAKTQPAVRRAASNVGAEAGGLETAAPTASKVDPIGFKGNAEAIKSRAKPVFEAIDKASDGAFSAAQKEADLARKALDFEGKKAYQAALDKQQAIFDSIEAMQGKGEMPDLAPDALASAKSDWKKAVGMDELGARFDRTIHPTPASILKAGEADSGYINPKQFREAITDAMQNGEFEKAGFSPEHVQTLEDLGKILEKQQVKFTDAMTTLTRLLKRGGVEAAIGAIAGGPLGAAGAAVLAESGKWVTGEVLSRIMTSPRASRTLLEGLKLGVSTDALAQRLKAALKSESGEMTVPFTGKVEEESALAKAAKTAGQFADDAAAAAAKGRRPNASGESSASQEAISRLSGEKAQGLSRVVVDTRSGVERKLLGVDAVDYRPAPFESVEFRGGTRDGEVIDQGSKARSYTRKSSFATDQQIAAHEAGGGSTFSSDGKNMTGADKYSVGSYPERTKQIKGDLKPKQLQKFKEENADVLSKPDHAIGTWKDPDTGNSVLDVVKLYDDKDAAIGAGIKANQKGIYGLKNGDYIETGGTGEASFRVGQRRPSAADSEQGHNPGLNLSTDVIGQAAEDSPKYLQSLADRVAEYPSMKFASEGAAEAFDTTDLAKLDPKKTVASFIKQAADNIEWLHNQIPASLREKARQWYDSANKMTKQFAADYGVSHPQAAGVTAVLSPQNPWDNNISLAKRVLDVWKNRQNFKWSPEMNRKAAELYGQSETIAQYSEMVRGKTFAQLADADPEVLAAKRALWARLYDEAHNPRTFERWAPDGSSRGIARNTTGEPSRSSWFSLDPIAKAMRILDDGSMDNLNQQLGGNHKVRNFYNNIIDPMSKMGDTTVDTHAVGAAHLSPFSLMDAEVVDNFKSPSNSAHGLKGTYPLYAEAYKVAAKRLGILPREVQSITWEGVRSLFKDKSPEVQAAVRSIWKEYQDGEISLNAARKKIVRSAGGFKPPEWESDLGANAAAEGAGNTGELSGTGVPPKEPQANPRARSRSSRAVPASRAEAEKSVQTRKITLTN